MVLCCATCTLVFHVNCARPKLQDEPPDDWMCAYCCVECVGGKNDGKERSKATQACREMERMKRECVKEHANEDEGSSEGGVPCAAPSEDNFVLDMNNDDNIEDDDDYEGHKKTTKRIKTTKTTKMTKTTKITKTIKTTTARFQAKTTKTTKRTKMTKTTKTTMARFQAKTTKTTKTMKMTKTTKTTTARFQAKTTKMTKMTKTTNTANTTKTTKMRKTRKMWGPSATRWREECPARLTLH